MQQMDSAWEQYVGSQTPQEFMRLSECLGQETPEAAVEAYLAEYLRDYPEWLDPVPVEPVTEALVRYIKRELGV